MVACLGNILQGIGYGSSTARYSQTCHTALKRSHSVFKHALCAVGEAAIDVAGIAKPEAVGCMLWIAKYIGCCLIDWHCPCISCRVGLLLSYMQLQCLKSEFLFCCHKSFPFYTFFVLYYYNNYFVSRATTPQYCRRSCLLFVLRKFIYGRKNEQ